MIALGYGAFLKDYLKYSKTSISRDISKIYVDEEFKKSSHWEGYELITDLTPYSGEEFICTLADAFHNYRFYLLATSKGLQLTEKYYITPVGNEEFSHDIEIGGGTIIGPHCAIYSNTKIGKGCHIVHHALISHDVKIGDFNLIMGGYSTIGGYTKIGDRNMIARGCHIRDSVTIGSNCSISMGSIIMKNIPDNKIVYTNSTKTLNKINRKHELI